MARQAAGTPTAGTHTVEKIGGTSMAQPDVLVEHVLIGGRTGRDLYDRVFVVSAYAGITNALLEHKSSGEPGVYALFAGAQSGSAWDAALENVAGQMLRINAGIFDQGEARRVADDFVRDRIAGVRDCLNNLNGLCAYGHFRLSEHLLTVREMLSALGEAHSAHNTALKLRQRGVNARFVDLTGWCEETHPSLDERILNAFEGIDLASELPIVTGYAQCRDGLMHVFDRGYTEVTFSRIAALTGAREAIIHKAFHLSSADPNVVGVDRVRIIGHTNYDVADQLSNMGMEAIHPQAAKGLRQAGIPLRVRNTFEPAHDGTIISGDYVSRRPRVEIVTGLKNVVALQFFEQEMVGIKGYDAAILDTLTRHRLRIVTKSSNANTITHYLAGSLASVKRAVADLEQAFPSADVGMRKVAIVSVIGSDLNVPGLTCTAISTLARAGIEIFGLHQGMRRVDIQFILDGADFDVAARALHRALVETTGADDVAEASAPANKAA